jgi:molybdopterin converting factor small subunit
LQDYYHVPGQLDVEGNTVGHCLERIIAQYPRAAEWLANPGGLLQLVINVNNDKTVAPNAEGLSTPVRDGDQLDIFALIGGG